MQTINWLRRILFAGLIFLTGVVSATPQFLQQLETQLQASLTSGYDVTASLQLYQQEAAQRQAEFDRIGTELSALPAVIVQRHRNTVADYQHRMTTLLGHLQAITTATTNELKHSHTQQALTYLRSLQPQATQVRHAPTTRRGTRDGDPDLSEAPTAADLAASEEVQITPEIEALALQLENKPVAIFNWVRNSIEFVPSAGAIQGSHQTLLSRRGNAYDTASLLIALLRAAQIPARYVYGTVQIPATQVMSWLGGVQTAEAAMQLLNQGGIANTAVIAGGKVTHLQLEHIWVNAWVDYFPSRGAINRKGDSWVPLDASFKLTQIMAGLDWPVPFASDEFANQLQSGSDYSETWLTSTDEALLQSTLTDYQSNLWQWLLDNPSNSLAAWLGNSELQSFTRPTLAASLPYKLVTRAYEYASLPADLIHNYQFSLYYDAATYRQGNALLNYQASLPSLAGKSMSLVFVPAGPEDVATLNSFVSEGQLPSQLPAYLVHLNAELRVDGAVVASAGPYTMGTQLLSESVYTPVNLTSEATLSYPVTGEYRVFGWDLHGNLSVELEAQVGESVGDLLQAGLSDYFAANDIYTSWQAQLADVSAYRSPSFGTARTVLEADLVLGIPQRVVLQGVGLEIERLAVQGLARNNDAEVTRRFKRQVGRLGSALAHLVLEKTFGAEQGSGVSALRALATALAAEQRVYTLDSSSAEAVLEQLNLTAAATEFVASALQRGWQVTVPSETVSQADWQGRGIAANDVATGHCAYPIFGSGGVATGMLFSEVGQRFGWAGLLPSSIAVEEQVAAVQAVVTGLLPLAANPLAVGATEKGAI